MLLTAADEIKPRLKPQMHAFLNSIHDTIIHPTKRESFQGKLDTPSPLLHLISTVLHAEVVVLAVRIIQPH